MNGVAAALEATLAGGPRPGWLAASAIGVAILAHAAGTARLTWADVRESATIPVAAIHTDSDVHGPPLPARDATHAWDRALLDRTRAAARGGAALAVWPEAATLVWPDEEEAWTESVRAVAREGGIDVVAAYVIPARAAPFAYRNEYRLILRDSRVTATYAKHHPVPGEPAIVGVGPAPIAERDWGRLSGAICYDLDFPAVSREAAQAGADIVAVPASDWRGIDPVHAQMTVLRAIESGTSVLRATRFGLSLAADGYGRVRAWHSAFEGGSGVMFAELPRARVPTLYAYWGDAPLFVAVALLAVLMATRLREGARPRTSTVTRRG